MISFVDSRNALHHLARFVLAADLEGTTDLVTLRATTGGFGQPERLIDGLQRRLRMDGSQIVVQRGEDEEWTLVTTLREAARSAGVTLAADAPDPDAPLALDLAHVESLAQFFSVTDTALAQFRRCHAHDRPTIVQLFPHHFDLAISLREVNIGGSPGDGDHDAPYFYVGPWNVAPHPMWNEPWGASMPWTDAITVDDVVAFFVAAFSAAGV